MLRSNVNNLRSLWIPEEKKKVCGGKDLQKRKVLSFE